MTTGELMGVANKLTESRNILTGIPTRKLPFTVTDPIEDARKKIDNALNAMKTVIGDAVMREAA